jgi:UDP-N-acetylglucosamine:LPS N-acetylglucosamine transferase
LKAGPGTIAEALIRGLPIILNDFIPGQVWAFFIRESLVILKSHIKVI